MKHKQIVRAGCILAVILNLIGCETDPENIAKWKAEGNTEKLTQVLKDSRQFVRLDAIVALGALNDEKAVAPLGALLQDHDVVIVHASIDALAAIGTPSIEPYMLTAITLPTEPARLTAAKVLGQLKSKHAVKPLCIALNDDFENIARAAAISLGQIGDPKAIPALSKTASKGSVRLRLASTTSIRTIGGKTAIKALAEAMDDISIAVRNEAIVGLIDAGDAAEPVALNALSSRNDYSRECALSILRGIHKIPTLGNDAVWYQLASLSEGDTAKYNKEDARKIAKIANGQDALIAALSYPSKTIREHAFQALETIGEPAAAPLIAAAAFANPDAIEWLNGRSNWAGAPAWQLDLWGAATALSPIFEVDQHRARLLAEESSTTEDMLRSTDFRPTRELIPLLINQMAILESKDQKDNKSATLRRDLTVRKLRAYKQRSKLPLMAAVYDDDIQIAAQAATILILIKDDPRTIHAVIDSFSKRVEAGERLSATPFHAAMLQLNRPEADALLLRIRPNPAEAIRIFEKKFPGIRVSNIEMPPPDKVIQAEGFRLKYMIDGRAKELKVIFQPNAEGDWVPNPPLPDELP